MSRRVFQSAKFNGGMILNADPCDLPEGFGVASVDTMASPDSGSIGGRYADGAEDGYDGVRQYTYLTHDSEYHLAYLDADGQIYVDGQMQMLYAYALHAKCITGHSNFALIGRGKDQMPLYYGYPNGVTEAVFSDHDMDPNYISVEKEQWIGDPFIARGSIVYYAASIVYDGYMHGPLKKLCSFEIDQGEMPAGTILVPLSLGTIRLTLTINVPFGMEHRVSKVILYRSVQSPGVSEANQSSEYTNVREFTDTSSMVYVEGNDVKDIVGTTTVAGYTPEIGNSYANESELDETLTFCTLGYETAFEMNNFLFVGSVGHVHQSGYNPNGSPIFTQDLEDGSRMLYRSIRGKPGQFRIIDDYLVLPFTPVAITSYNARLIVFGSAEFAVVNPETMTLEDTINGYGIESDLCVYQALEGIFFANRNNMYVYDGQRVIPIGNPVMRCWDAEVISALTYVNVLSYEQIVESGGIINIVYSPRINSILFLYAVNSATYAYVFSLDTKVWSVSSFGSTSAASAYITRSNVLYIGNRAAMASQDKVTSWKYITGRYTLGASSQAKKIYEIILNATNHNAICQGSFDSGEFIALDEPQVPAENRLSKTVMIKFDPNEIYATYLSSIEIVYRDMHVH